MTVNKIQALYTAVNIRLQLLKYVQLFTELRLYNCSPQN